jgi:hypothetical protein
MLKMKLFNMDLHISVIADFKNLFPAFDITDWCLSGHSWVFNRPQRVPNHINPSTWIHLNEEMIRAFQAEYDAFLRTFDGFICGHPNGFVLLFEKYEKPIILINSCRYDLPFCFSKNYKMLESYKACLHRLHEKGQLIAVSNNKADQLYMKLGCGIDTTHIPSLCAYTGISYIPTRSTFLFYNDMMIKHPLITNKSELGQPFKWSDLSQFRGIIHVPYEVSTMSMFEHFSAGIPLFFPSKRFMQESFPLSSVKAYWDAHLPKDLAPMADKSAWLAHADFYEVFHSPNVHYYDSFPHLFELLTSFRWVDDRAVLETYKKDIRTKWATVLGKHFPAMLLQ